MRGRKPKPTHLRLLEGNRENRPLREEPRPPPLFKLPEPPVELTVEAREEWDRLGGDLVAMGLLTTADLQTFACYCTACGRWVVAERALARLAAMDEQTRGLMIRTTGGNAIQNPLVGTANRAMADVMKYGTEFGLTPSARTRIAAGAVPPATSKFEGLLA